MLSEIKNLAIVGLFAVLLICFGIYIGKRSLTPRGIKNRYYQMFHLSDASPIADYPFSYEADSKALYLNLMKLALRDSIYDSPLEVKSSEIRGDAWPSRAFTMIGLKQLNNIQACMEDVINNGVPGDFVEAGAWRGGATIFMRAILKALNNSERKVWVADSFEGLPPPDAKSYPSDAGLDLSMLNVLAVSEKAVQQHFKRFGLLDNQVVFLKGFFKDSLPRAPIDRLAVLRIDADLYQSTFEALTYLYPKLSRGGYAIVDDYRTTAACRKAVDIYRQKNAITEQIRNVDDLAIYWQKE